jgi:hypothetical protein
VSPDQKHELNERIPNLIDVSENIEEAWIETHDKLQHQMKREPHAKKIAPSLKLVFGFWPGKLHKLMLVTAITTACLLAVLWRAIILSALADFFCFWIVFAITLFTRMLVRMMGVFGAEHSFQFVDE